MTLLTADRFDWLHGQWQAHRTYAQRSAASFVNQGNGMHTDFTNSDATVIRIADMHVNVPITSALHTPGSVKDDPSTRSVMS